MRFDIITIFPEIIDFYFGEKREEAKAEFLHSRASDKTHFAEVYFQHSILEKAQKKGIVKIKAHNLRDFTFRQAPFDPAQDRQGRRQQVDDKPFGGGRGMVMKAEPLYKAIKKIKKGKKSKVVLFTPRGKKFNQKMATEWSKLNQLVFIAGRYEGVDERIYKYVVDERVSIGDYVLMGGELPSLVAIEAVSRLIPGVIGKSESLIKDRITKTKGFVEYPQYTRPEVISINGKKRCVPKVLLSGDHKKIQEWRAKHSKTIL